jgi:DNA polymerase-3 subunit alpha
MKIRFKNQHLTEKRKLRLQETKVDSKERVRLERTAINTVEVIALKVKEEEKEADVWEVIQTLPMSLFIDKNGRSLFKNRSKFFAIHDNDHLEVVRYVNLHGHSEYSILDCISRITDIVAKAEWAIAVTDHGNMFGSLEFYKEMKKAGKKPLIGFEAYHYSRNNEVKSHHLVLLAKNGIGVKNLFKLTSNGYHNFNSKPQITWEDMKEYSEGVVCLSACIAGEIPQAILRGEMDEARSLIQGMIDIFGKENYYLEIQRHGLAEEKIVEKAILELAVEFDLKVVATTDSHFTNKEDKGIHDIHLCIGTKRLLSDPTRWTFTGDGYHIHTSEEMVERFADLPDVLDNTLDLAEMLEPTLDTGNVFMPSFPLPEPFTGENEYLRNLVMKGFEKRFKGKSAFTSDEYKERIEFELETVQRMGFPGYFLIVWDFVRFAKEKGILVGPGRGSACGSLLTYCLGITNVDPIPFGLLFERFLNPDRISMPDIDIDFPDTRREEVLEYVRNMYGNESVAGVITFGKMKAKSVSRDVCRVMGFPTSVGDAIAKMVPAKLEEGGKSVKVTLKNLLRLSPDFSRLYKGNPDVQKIVDSAIQLEGLPRTLSQHACAVLIAPRAVSNYIPLVTLPNKATGGRDTVTQFSMGQCEEMGILKMDFLGLRTMGVFDRTLQYINQMRSKGKHIELDDIPIGDHSVYDFIAKGNTAGVFQLESPGMTGLMGQLYQDLHKMKGTEEEGIQLFERLVAGVSLYRPGPMDEIPNYVKNMLTPNGIHYELPDIKDVMTPTYNVIVYQEQVMFIVRILAGFSKGDADSVRKAMGKKDEELLAKYGKYFLYGDAEKGIIGAIANGIKKEIAEELWERMKKFGLYAFNKSHAVGYSDIAIRSAWMSYYYPTEFMTGTLNSFLSKADRIKQFMTVCKNRGISVLPPDVNHSVQDFKVDGNAIRFGFGGIRNMGSYGELIIKERESNSQFTSLFNFIERMATGYGINRKRIESLIYAGALDSFNGSRQEKLGMIDLLVGLASVAKGDSSNGTYSLLSMPMFSPLSTHLFGSKGIKEMPEKMRLEKEREFTGFYVSGHPMNEYEAVFNNPHIKNFYPINQTLPTHVEDALEEDNLMEDHALSGEMIRIAGVVQEVEVRTTRNHQQMANIVIEDTTATIKAIIFPITFSQHIQRIRNGEVLAFYGKVEVSEFGTQFIVNGIETMDELMTPDDVESMTLYLNANLAEARMEFEEVMGIFKERPLENKVSVSIVMDGKTYSKRGGSLILGNTKLSTIVKLQTLLGRQSVSVHYDK